MTIAQKVFWFFALALVVNVGLSLAGYGTNEKPAQEPVKTAEKCSPGQFKYSIALYEGNKLIERAWFRCDNGSYISSSK